ncbi:aldo/keto reductase [Haloferax larsenii]|uniref:Aldo/keto reductase n=1 Tax=Haloferax larsenii TaxID=302484 RepID=A0ABY5RB09_HALLR|nr:aldo/keto reductase [Haloferax larsenii]UVE49210.1 aldo/keto reductase [Haloferax larsenii]
MESVSVHGVAVPALGLGTARMRGDECRQAVMTGLELGYRHIDTAQMYKNEDAVGDAVAQSSVDRDEVFLVTKLLRGNLRYDDVLDSFAESLDRLQMEYVDLLLIHAPSRSVPVSESVRAMNELQDQGAVNHIGVSNFSVSQLQEAMEASETPILTNQVEYHPFKSQGSLLEFCIENDVLLTAYSPLNLGSGLSDEMLQEIGTRHGKTPAQVALRWLVQQEYVAAIPKASQERHLAENIDIFDFELSEAEMEQVFELQGGLLTRLRSLLQL